MYVANVALLNFKQQEASHSYDWNESELEKNVVKNSWLMDLNTFLFVLNEKWYFLS